MFWRFVPVVHDKKKTEGAAGREGGQEKEREGRMGWEGSLLVSSGAVW